MIQSILEIQEQGKVREITVRAGETFGRDAGNHHILVDKTAGSRHFKLVELEGELGIEDLGSAHGTKIEGGRILGAGQRQPLKEGLVFWAGETHVSVKELERPQAAAGTAEAVGATVRIGASAPVPPGATGARVEDSEDEEDVAVQPPSDRLPIPPASIRKVEPREDKKKEPEKETPQYTEGTFEYGEVGPPLVKTEKTDEGPQGEGKETVRRLSRLAVAHGGTQKNVEVRGTPEDDKGRYVREEEVARGGMGLIYKVRDTDLHRTIAMKVSLDAPEEKESPPDPGSSPELFVRFLEEAQITAQLDHPGVVPVHDLGINEAGQMYFTMRLVKGRELGKIFALALAEKDGWNFPRAVGVMVKACQAVAYAHSKKVIHRDLKPANVMVGRFGEVYVMDWGLAKVVGREDLHDIRFKDYSLMTYAPVHSARKSAGEDSTQSPLVTMDGSVFGTPAYMPPEQAKGLVDEVDDASDVYSLGAILYRLLTGQSPYVDPTAKISPRTILARVLDGPPKAVHRLNPQAPPELAAICEKAMAREKTARYSSSLDMAEDLQAYLDRRVVRAYRTGALAEFKSWVRRNKGMAASVAAAVVLAVAGLAGIIWVQTRAKYEILLRTDVDVVSALEVSAGSDLWPAYPKKIPAMEQWLAKASELAGRLHVHRQRLAALPDEALPEHPDVELQRGAMASLVEGLETLVDSEKGTIADVEKRLAFARTVRQRTIDDHREEWDTAIASIADRSECPRYDGLEIRPQVGLIPIGRDARSGLWEFWNLQSGERPTRRKDGQLTLGDDGGLVFILVPGGTFRMGAVGPGDEGTHGGEGKRKRNMDPRAQRDEGPVHEVTLEPFFISKYEMNQGQWFRFTGETPSVYGAEGGESSLLHPVEAVSWKECQKVLFQLGLELPTEAQWEYAARAGTTTPWWTGEAKEALETAANLADQSQKEIGAGWKCETWSDGFNLHAPVGYYRPNPFGLHDVHGNVWEWCRDLYGSYELAVKAGDGERLVEDTRARLRVNRGGYYSSLASVARSANRSRYLPGHESNYFGVRPSRRLMNE